MLVYKKKFEGVLIREGMFIGRRVLCDIITVISEIFESLSNSLKKKIKFKECYFEWAFKQGNKY